jgi:hypothetical protein
MSPITLQSSEKKYDMPMVLIPFLSRPGMSRGGVVKSSMAHGKRDRAIAADMDRDCCDPMGKSAGSPDTLYLGVKKHM